MADNARLGRLGKYQLHESLGSGAFAEVYRATDTVLKRVVALKVLRPALIADEEAFARFVQEAQVTSALFQPHIATVLDLGEAEGRYFLAMRYVDGPTLSKLIKTKGALPWAEALRLAQHISAALHFAHERGLVHRDVKPSNILVSPTDGAMLTDFGLVKAYQSTGMTARTGAIMGTPQYIPPEVWRGKLATPAADQYALACVLVEMLTGRALYDGGTPWAVMQKHSQPPQFPAQWPNGTPAGLSGVLARALSNEPHQRYPSCVAFMQAINQLAAPSRPNPVPEGMETPTSPKPGEALPTGPQGLITAARVARLKIIHRLTALADRSPLAKSAPARQVHHVAFSANGYFLAAWHFGGDAGYDGILSVWTRPNKLVKELKTPGVRCLSILPNFSGYAVGLDDWTVHLRPLMGLQAEAIFEGHLSPLRDVTISPDGKVLASGAEDGEVRVWDLRSGKALTSPPAHKNPVQYLAFSADSRYLASHDLADVHIWSLAEKSPYGIGFATRGPLLFTPNGKHLAASCSASAPQGEQKFSLKLIPLDYHQHISTYTPDCSLGMAFSPDGTLLAELAAQQIKIWQMPNRLLHTLSSPGTPNYYCATFSPDGTLLAAGADGGVILWGVQ